MLDMFGGSVVVQNVSSYGGNNWKFYFGWHCICVDALISLSELTCTIVRNM